MPLKVVLNQGHVPDLNNVHRQDPKLQQRITAEAN